MEPRINLFGNPVATAFIKRLQAVHQPVAESGLPETTQELVRIRVSQINGCAVCLDMHAKEALRAGESQVRLNLVAGWRDTALFTEAERAALDLAERGTRIADAAEGVTDEAWDNAAKHYDEDQLAALVATITEINAWNRMSVITGQLGGSYEPGQFG